MGVGLEVYNASGQRRFNSSDYLVRFLGSVQVGVTAGSINDPNLATSNATPFYIFYPANLGSKSGNICPYVSISGTTVSWNWSDSGDTTKRSNGLLFWGLR